MKRSRTSKKLRINSTITVLKSKFYRGIILFGIFSLLLIFFLGDHGLYQLYKIRTQRKVIKNRIEELKAERTILENEKKRLQTDTDYIERLAREKYRMAKKGEKVFKVIPRE